MLRTNTCKAEIFCYTFRRVIITNCSETIIKSSKVHSTLISRKHKVHVTLEDKDYVIPVACKSSLTKSSSISNPTLIVNKYNNIISSKFKAIKFTL